jgi:hypothetical protein
MLKIKNVFISFILCVAFTVQAYSWDLGLGVTSYYSYWEPAYIKAYNNDKVDPVLMAGPVISLQVFEKWTIGLQGIISVKNFNSEYTVFVPGAGNVTITSSCERMEAEAGIMYSASSCFKIFAGYKHISFDEKGLNHIQVPAGYSSNVDFWENQFQISGPGAGIALILPVTENLKATLSTSLLYFDMTYQGYYLIKNGTNIESDNVDYSYHGYGNNSSLVFTYFVQSFNTAISTGARCQYIKYKSEGGAPDLDSDLNYGVTLSAMYFI